MIGDGASSSAMRAMTCGARTMTQKFPHHAKLAFLPPHQNDSLPHMFTTRLRR
ncbi:hypothetical protein Pla52o_25450 [Novipirellula galeiformis]|uniref:Uncharacterized protein n=1 Tax=Novipirellula galeiformis TaxID=2528004 RepID=A0A5C6CI53_9BACT|nr:hypothetical protein Pla52o_25450 [Novipirellula galeiformis]